MENKTRAYIHTHTHTHTSMTLSLVLLELLHAEQHKLFAKSSKVCVCIAFKPSSLTLLLVLPIFVKGKCFIKSSSCVALPLPLLSRFRRQKPPPPPPLDVAFAALVLLQLLLPKDDDCFFQTRGDFPSERRLCRLMMTPTILPLPLPLPRRRRRRLQEVVEEKEGVRSRRKAPQKSNASVRKTAIA